jgi:hypothetical protein
MVTANQASIYLPFCQFDYILPLVVCSHILYVVVPIAAMLHINSYDLIEAVSECQTLIRYFETERNDISVYNTLYDEAVALVEQFGVVSSKPQTTGKQRNHANPQVTDTKEYWWIILYYQFNLNKLKQEDELHVYDAYRADLQTQEIGGTQEELTLESKKWKPRWELHQTR